MPEGKLAESVASDRLAAKLAEHWTSGGVTSVTWLNHHSALKLGLPGIASLAPMTYIGIDGLLLLNLVGGQSHDRSSADQVVPRLLSLLRGARVALVGTDRASLERASEVVTHELLAEDSVIVDTRDGFDGLPAIADIRAWLRHYRPDVVIVGLGAGLQEPWALEVCAHLSSGLVITCGALLDQLRQPGYYPRWAYPLKLNWAVRLAREPRRLWRRYSVEALYAVRHRRALRREIECLAGFHTYRAVVNGGFR